MSESSELGRVKIVKIENKKIRNRYPRLYGKNARLAEHGYGHDIGIVTMETNCGTVGWGMGHCSNEKKELFIGKELGELFDPAIGVLSEAAYDIDLALHDLAGKVVGKPIFQMINGSLGISGNCVNCYDGAIYMNDISPDVSRRDVNAVIEDCRYDYDVLGFRDFKVKIGRGNKWMAYEEGLAQDIKVIRAIRKEFPNCGIMVDANDGYNLETTIKFMDAVSDCDISWLEEPFVENVDDFYKLREYLSAKSPKTLIADGESHWNVDLLIELSQKGIIDVLLMDVHGFGFTKWRKLMPALKDLKVLASPHCWGEKLKTHYAAHLAVAYDIVPTIEGVPDETEGVVFAGYKLGNGKLEVPNGAGFGMDLIWGENR